MIQRAKAFLIMCAVVVSAGVLSLLLFLSQPCEREEEKTMDAPPSFSALRAALSDDDVKIVFEVQHRTNLSLPDMVIQGAAKDRLRRILISRIPAEVSGPRRYIPDLPQGVLSVESKAHKCVVHVFWKSFTPELDDVSNTMYRVECPELYELLEREARKQEELKDRK